MRKDAIYLVDSDVFITAKNLYYAFGLCPGFWKSVLHHHRTGRIFSVDRVRGELLAGNFPTCATSSVWSTPTSSRCFGRWMSSSTGRDR